MQDSYIQTDKDLLELGLPPFETVSSETTTEVSAKSPNAAALIKDNSFITLTFSITFLILLFFFIIFVIKGMLNIHNSPVAKFTRQQKSKVKQKAYVSSANRLDTPENINDCIRLFLERTR